MATNVLLDDPALFVGKNYINGQWVPAISGKTFDVAGKHVYVSRILQETADRCNQTQRRAFCLVHAQSQMSRTPERRSRVQLLLCHIGECKLTARDHAYCDAGTIS